MQNKYPIDEPMNVEDRYMYAMITRLDALCHMVSSIVEYIAERDGIAVENNKVVEKPKATRKKKTEE